MGISKRTSSLCISDEIEVATIGIDEAMLERRFDQDDFFLLIVVNV